MSFLKIVFIIWFVILCVSVYKAAQVAMLAHPRERKPATTQEDNAAVGFAFLNLLAFGWLVFHCFF